MFKLCFGIVIDTNVTDKCDNSNAQKLEDLTKLAGTILSSSSSRVELPSVFTTSVVLTLPRHCVRALHITGYNHLCQYFRLHFVVLTLANTRENGCTILQHKVPNFKPSIFSIPR